MTRAARRDDGQDVVIRVLSIGTEGSDHVELLTAITRDSLSLLHSCHALPLIDIIQLEDITLGVFPKAAGSVNWAYGFWAKPSVDDILDIIAQCLDVRRVVLQ